VQDDVFGRIRVPGTRFEARLVNTTYPPFPEIVGV
jgi:hypothetical protein